MTTGSAHTAPSDTTRGGSLPGTLRILSLLAVITIIWQGATAGGILMRSDTSYELHQAGAIAVHVATGLTAVVAFLLWRSTRARLWPTVVAAVVFAASFLQAALGDYDTMWAHVPGALLLILGSAAVATWAFLRPPSPAR